MTAIVLLISVGLDLQGLRAASHVVKPVITFCTQNHHHDKYSEYDLKKCAEGNFDLSIMEPELIWTVMYTY